MFKVIQNTERVPAKLKELSEGDCFEHSGVFYCVLDEGINTEAGYMTCISFYANMVPSLAQFDLDTHGDLEVFIVDMELHIK